MERRKLKMPISVPCQDTLMKTLLEILFEKKKAQEEMKFTKSTATKFLMLKAENYWKILGILQRHEQSVLSLIVLC